MVNVILSIGYTAMGAGVLGTAYMFYHNRKELIKKIKHDVIEEYQRTATNQDVKVDYKTLENFLK